MDLTVVPPCNIDSVTKRCLHFRLHNATVRACRTKKLSKNLRFKIHERKDQPCHKNIIVENLVQVYIHIFTNIYTSIYLCQSRQPHPGKVHVCRVYAAKSCQEQNVCFVFIRASQVCKHSTQTFANKEETAKMHTTLYFQSSICFTQKTVLLLHTNSACILLHFCS